MTEETTKSRITKRKYYSGLFVPAGLLIGMGVGWALGPLIAGLFIGLGCGFLPFAVIMVFVKE